MNRWDLDYSRNNDNLLRRLGSGIVCGSASDLASGSGDGDLDNNALERAGSDDGDDGEAGGGVGGGDGDVAVGGRERQYGSSEREKRVKIEERERKRDEPLREGITKVAETKTGECLAEKGGDGLKREYHQFDETADR
jgi:hypothetical protein